MISSEIRNGISHIYRNDERLSRVIDISGECKIRPRRDHYHSILKAIVNQQLSTFAADAIYKRFLKYFDNNPTPEKILASNDEELRKLGISYGKIKYIKDFSARLSEKSLSLKGLSKKSDDEIIEELIPVKGVGVWTVQMFLIFNLARLNVLPVNDLGIKKGAMIVYNLRKLPDEKKLRQISKRNNWAPYNSIACWYLWKSLEYKDQL